MKINEWPRHQPPLVSPWSNAPQYHLAQTGSTMDDARLLLQQNPIDGALVLADYQTRGRGRTRQRRWVSARGRNLLFNLVLNENTVGPRPQRLPLLSGLAIARALEKMFDLSCQLKWPNDVIIDSCKVAGCLCERISGWYSLGIGITCNQVLSLPKRFSAGLSATSIRRVLGYPISRWELLEVFLSEIYNLLRAPFSSEDINQRLFARGHWVRISDAGHQIPEIAKVVRIGTEGELVVRNSTGTEVSCHAGSMNLLAAD